MLTLSNAPEASPEMAVDIAHLNATDDRWGLRLLCGFAFIYPLLNGPQPYSNNAVKFYALAIFSSLLAILLLAPILRCPRIFPLNRRTRICVTIGALLGIYAVLLSGVRVESLLVLLLLPSLALLLAHPRLNPWLPQPIHRILTTLVILVGAACFLSAYQYTALVGHGYRRTGLATFCACVLLFMGGIRFLHTKENAWLVVRWLLIGSVPVALIALLQFFDREQFMASYFTTLVKDPRPIGTMGQANWFGTYLLLLFPFAMHWSVQKHSWGWTVITGLLFSSLLLAQTRGAWIAGTLLVLAYAWHTRRQWRSQLRLAAVFGLLTILLVPWNNYQILQRAGSVHDEAGKALQGRDDTGSGRFGFWRYALHHVPNRVALGAGLDTLSHLATEDRPAPDSKAHSVYLEYAVTIGVIGLFCWIAFLWQCFSRIGSAGDPIVWRMVLWTYLAQGIFIHDTIQTWPILWLLAAAAVAAGRNR